MSDASDSNATQHVMREPDEIEGLADTVQAFLAAFAALDWEPFRRSFADDATVFFPLTDHPQRAEGREEIERLFRGVFERARADSPSGPPYLALQPHDLSIRRMGDMGEGACVTFHLHDPGVLCRRTLILCHGAEGWKIVHLHASNLAAPDPER
jgi:ketosteroid isomerase-like protein